MDIPKISLNASFEYEKEREESLLLQESVLNETSCKINGIFETFTTQINDSRVKLELLLPSSQNSRQSGFLNKLNHKFALFNSSIALLSKLNQLLPATEYIFTPNLDDINTFKSVCLVVQQVQTKFHHIVSFYIQNTFVFKENGDFLKSLESIELGLLTQWFLIIFITFHFHALLSVFQMAQSAMKSFWNPTIIAQLSSRSESSDELFRKFICDFFNIKCAWDFLKSDFLDELQKSFLDIRNSVGEKLHDHSNISIIIISRINAKLKNHGCPSLDIFDSWIHHHYKLAVPSNLIEEWETFFQDQEHLALVNHVLQLLFHKINTIALTSNIRSFMMLCRSIISPCFSLNTYSKNLKSFTIIKKWITKGRNEQRRHQKQESTPEISQNERYDKGHPSSIGYITNDTDNDHPLDYDVNSDFSKVSIDTNKGPIMNSSESSNNQGHQFYLSVIDDNIEILRQSSEYVVWTNKLLEEFSLLNDFKHSSIKLFTKSFHMKIGEFKNKVNDFFKECRKICHSTEFSEKYWKCYEKIHKKLIYQGHLLEYKFEEVQHYINKLWKIYSQVMTEIDEYVPQFTQLSLDIQKLPPREIVVFILQSKTEIIYSVKRCTHVIHKLSTYLETIQKLYLILRKSQSDILDKEATMKLTKTVNRLVTTVFSNLRMFIIKFQIYCIDVWANIDSCKMETIIEFENLFLEISDVVCNSLERYKIDATQISTVTPLLIYSQIFTFLAPCVSIKIHKIQNEVFGNQKYFNEDFQNHKVKIIDFLDQNSYTYHFSHDAEHDCDMLIGLLRQISPDLSRKDDMLVLKSQCGNIDLLDHELTNTAAKILGITEKHICAVNSIDVDVSNAVNISSTKNVVTSLYSSIHESQEIYLAYKMSELFSKPVDTQSLKLKLDSLTSLIASVLKRINFRDISLLIEEKFSTTLKELTKEPECVIDNTDFEYVFHVSHYLDLITRFQQDGKDLYVLIGLYRSLVHSGFIELAKNDLIDTKFQMRKLRKMVVQEFSSVRIGTHLYNINITPNGDHLMQDCNFVQKPQLVNVARCSHCSASEIGHIKLIKYFNQYASEFVDIQSFLQQHTLTEFEGDSILITMKNWREFFERLSDQFVSLNQNIFCDTINQLKSMVDSSYTDFISHYRLSIQSKFFDSREISDVTTFILRCLSYFGTFRRSRCIPMDCDTHIFEINHYIQRCQECLKYLGGITNIVNFPDVEKIGKSKYHICRELVLSLVYFYLKFSNIISRNEKINKRLREYGSMVDDFKKLLLEFEGIDQIRNENLKKIFVDFFQQSIYYFNEIGKFRVIISSMSKNKQTDEFMYASVVHSFCQVLSTTLNKLSSADNEKNYEPLKIRMKVACIIKRNFIDIILEDKIPSTFCCPEVIEKIFIFYFSLIYADDFMFTDFHSISIQIDEFQIYSKMLKYLKFKLCDVKKYEKFVFLKLKIQYFVLRLKALYKLTKTTGIAHFLSLDHSEKEAFDKLKNTYELSIKKLCFHDKKYIKYQRRIVGMFSDLSCLFEAPNLKPVKFKALEFTKVSLFEHLKLDDRYQKLMQNYNCVSDNPSSDNVAQEQKYFSSTIEKMFKKFKEHFNDSWLDKTPCSLISFHRIKIKTDIFARNYVTAGYHPEDVVQIWKQFYHNLFGFIASKVLDSQSLSQLELIINELKLLELSYHYVFSQTSNVLDRAGSGLNNFSKNVHFQLSRVEILINFVKVASILLNLLNEYVEEQNSISRRSQESNFQESEFQTLSIKSEVNLLVGCIIKHLKRLCCLPNFQDLFIKHVIIKLRELYNYMIDFNCNLAAYRQILQKSEYVLSFPIKFEMESAKLDIFMERLSKNTGKYEKRQLDSVFEHFNLLSMDLNHNLFTLASKKQKKLVGLPFHNKHISDDKIKKFNQQLLIFNHIYFENIPEDKYLVECDYSSIKDSNTVPDLLHVCFKKNKGPNVDVALSKKSSGYVSPVNDAKLGQDHEVDFKCDNNQKSQRLQDSLLKSNSDGLKIYEDSNCQIVEEKEKVIEKVRKVASTSTPIKNRTKVTDKKHWRYL
ncbi:hypothetical protein RF11_05479 [Thelohanellus kitauei]|uniref:Uncharacterized protein n=1 Tax=Thelohanellus kitauei TaxID=669202 RepID=A0A0C2MJY2_THEKT|nr:hypothetical protein RF11_05479 [Thelohanellus kitauei]